MGQNEQEKLEIDLFCEDAEAFMVPSAEAAHSCRHSCNGQANVHPTVSSLCTDAAEKERPLLSSQ